jgi:benzoyl-CoA-dihydrodiol lyase
LPARWPRSCGRGPQLHDGGEFEGDNRPLPRSAVEGQFRPLPDGERPDPPADPLSWATRGGRGAEAQIGTPLEAEAARELGLITFAYDDIDWEDELRIFLEERASFSPDALTGMEANLRFAGPETMETRIFGRLTAWQNWIFQRPNAVGA